MEQRSEIVAREISIHALRVEGDIAQNWRPRL